MITSRQQNLTLLRDFLHTDGAWSIVTGLRGPDCGDYHLKTFTTSVLRHFVPIPKKIVQLLDTPNTPKTAKQYWNDLTTATKYKIAIKWNSEHHFRSHFRSAMYSLGAEAHQYSKWIEKELTQAGRL